MTIEEEFFKTFGIEPTKECYYWDCPYSTGEVAKDVPMNERNCKECKNPDKEVYPPITDRILLKLICINPLCVEFVRPKNVQELKFLIIDYYIKDLQSYANEDEAELFKNQVQSSFKGVEE